MKRALVVIGLVVAHLVFVGIYYVLSSEEAGATMLLIFGFAMGLFLWILIPTAGDVGPTAPVDPDWHERRS